MKSNGPKILISNSNNDSNLSKDSKVSEDKLTELLIQNGLESNKRQTIDEKDYAQQLLIKVANENMDLQQQVNRNGELINHLISKPVFLIPSDAQEDQQQQLRQRIQGIQ